MYAVIQFGSSQYKVSEGDVIEVDRLQEKIGKDITVSDVLIFAKGKDIRIGQPFLKDVKVKAQVLSNIRGKKVTAFKFRVRKSASKKIGARADYTKLSIKKIDV